MSQVTLIRNIAASCGEVFEAFTTPTGLAAWFGPDDGPVLIAEAEATVGGQWRVRFRMTDGTEHEAAGKFLVLEAPTRIVMTFQWAGSADDSGPSRIDITLRPVAGKTELTFVHAGLRDDAVSRSHEEGWSGAFEKLQRQFNPAGTG